MTSYLRTLSVLLIGLPLVNSCSDNPPQHARLWEQTIVNAREAYGKGEYSRARDLSKEAVKEARILGHDDFRLIGSLLTHGDCCLEEEKYPLALESFTQAIAVLDNQKTSLNLLNRFQVCAAWYGAGLAHRALGHANDSRDCFIEAVAQCEALRSLPMAARPESVVGDQWVGSLLALSQISRDNKQYEQSHKYLEESHKVASKGFVSSKLNAVFNQVGQNTDETAIRIHQLNQQAESEYQEGRLKESVEIYGQILKLQEKKFGPDDPALLGTLRQIAIYLSFQGKTSESLRNWLLIEEIQKKNFDDPGTQMESQSSIAEELMTLKRHVEAERRYDALVELHKNVSKTEKQLLEYSQVLLCASRNCAALDKLDKAIRLQQQCVDIRAKAFSPEDPRVLDPMQFLASLYMRAQQFSKAERLLRTCIRYYPDTSLPRRVCLRQLATLLSMKNDFAQAESVANQSLLAEEIAFGDDDPRLAVPLSRLVLCEIALKKFREADRNLKRVITISSHTLVDSALLAQAYLHLCQIHASDDPAVADSYFKKSLLAGEMAVVDRTRNAADHKNDVEVLLGITARYAEFLSRTNKRQEAAIIVQRLHFYTEKYKQKFANAVPPKGQHP